MSQNTQKYKKSCFSGLRNIAILRNIYDKSIIDKSIKCC